MYDRFTDRARKVMQLANIEVQQYNHAHIGTEHILLGIVQEGSGTAVNVLKNLNVDLKKVRPEVEKLIARGLEGMVTMGKLPQTPRAKKVLEFAMEEARNLGHHHVGTEHLLLGLIREKDGVAGIVLSGFGLTVKQVRQEVISILGSGGSAVEAESASAVHVAVPPGARTHVRSAYRIIMEHVEITSLWSTLAGSVGCPSNLLLELCRILREPQFFDRLKEVAELAKDELQKRGNPDKMLAAVLAQSRALASGCEHSTVEPMHVFVALVGEARGPVSESLSRCQVLYDKLREVLKQRFETGKPITESGLPLSRGVEDWMLAQFGRIAASDVGVDAATMLVDLIEASDRQVQRFLGDLGIMPGTLRAELLKTRERV